MSRSLTEKKLYRTANESFQHRRHKIKKIKRQKNNIEKKTLEKIISKEQQKIINKLIKKYS